jgi:hypothetical protein
LVEPLLALDYEPAFLEEAIRAALQSRPEGRLFYRQREAIYGLADAEERSAAFSALDAEWFGKLGLDEPLDRALAEQGLVLTGIGRCAIGRAPGARQRGAELLVREAGVGRPASEGRVLRLLFDPRDLLDGAALLEFLRRELQHVADMLDPAFGYEPRLEVAGGPAAQNAARDRYRALWDASVDGRLLRAGKLPATVREERWQDFDRSFGGARPQDAAAFESLFEQEQPTHAEIAAAVRESLRANGPSRGACALCGFPTLEIVTDGFDQVLVTTIRGDFPAWEQASGCCRQCADLYRARELSAREAAAIPGIR